jgi:hypothetical protein
MHDPNGFEKYVYKNDANKRVEKAVKKPSAARKKSGSRKKATVARD